MDLPVMPPVAPMLAKALPQLPLGDFLYEPKWDGFRSILFRDGDEVELASRNERPLTRYFPELVEAARRHLPDRVVLDGEIILSTTGDRLDFEVLQQRVHPAASRVARLSVEIPAQFVVFDILALGDEDLTGLPFAERRARLEAALGQGNTGPFHLTPATRDPTVAEEWFSRFEGAGLDGIIAKPLDEAYQPNVRAMRKYKHQRTADCVVAGFRWHKAGGVVGSLMLGLYDPEGRLRSVGVAASFTMARRAELVDELEAFRADGLAGHPWGGWQTDDPSAGGRLPGGPSRWNATRDLAFEALRPELVCEVAYDHMEGDRFRHTARFLRWRPDRDPASCTYEQLEVPVSYPLKAVLNLTEGPA